MFNIFKSAASFKELNGSDFKRIYEETHDAILLDVRTAGEFASGSIKGAKNVDFLSSGFAEKVDGLDKKKHYFLFCRSGNRSRQACELMASKGYHVYNLLGGISAWNSK